MRYLPILAALMLSGCLAQLEKKIEAVQTNTEATNATLETIESKLDAVLAEPTPVPRLQLSVPTPTDPPVPPAEPQKVDAPPVEQAGQRVTFQGHEIDVAQWLRRSVPLVEINGDVDAHLRYHGLDGDFGGLTRAQKIHLHSCVHSGVVALKPPVVANAAVVIPQSSNCPNGNCARMQYGAIQGRTRLFGRWR